MHACYLTKKPGVITTEQPYIESLRIEHIPDSDADTSYLEQEGFEDRLAAWKNGEFGFIGIRISAGVAYPVDALNVRLQEFHSPGIWGIEDDSGRDYFREVEREELAELKAHLERFGVDTSEIDMELGR